jgi:hypothetical protein
VNPMPILKRASASRQGGEWNDDDYDVLADGVVVDRIFLTAASNLIMPATDAERLTLGFHGDVSRAPYRIAPERAQELDELFGKCLTLVFDDGAANCSAQRNNDNSEIGVTFAALLSLWAVTRAALLIGNEAMAATRSRRSQIDIRTGTPIAQAYELINAAKNLIRDPQARWPNELPEPNAFAAERSPDWFTNNLFLGAVGWTLLHEVAHISLNYQTITTNSLRMQQEHDADKWATNWIFERVGQEEREFRIFATSTGIVWIGLIDTIRRGSPTHPHASAVFQMCGAVWGQPHLSGR